MSMIILGLLVPLSEFTGESIQLVRQVISNDPHSTYHAVIAETFLSLSLSLSWYNRRNYPQLSQDEKELHLIGYTIN